VSALVDFVMLRLEEQSYAAVPNCVVVSGGAPAPEVPNCIGPSFKGDCPERWTMEPHPSAEPGWYRTPEVQGKILAHRLTHMSREQRLTRAQADAFVNVLNASWNTRTMRTLQALYIARIWDDHVDYRPEWNHPR
jgi:hypothetical protein